MNGQTILEVIVAVAVIGVLVTVLTSAVTSSLSSVNLSKTNSQASQYAQEGMESMQQLRDSDYGTFAAKLTSVSTTYCLDSQKNLTSGLCSTSQRLNTIFSRNIIFEQGRGTSGPNANGCSVGVIKVSSRVSWTDSACATGVSCHESTLTSCFTNYSGVTAP